MPKLGPCEILVKIKAAALNPAEWRIHRFGVFSAQWPIVLAFNGNGAGIVQEVGVDVDQFIKGNRVCVRSFRLTVSVAPKMLNLFNDISNSTSQGIIHPDNSHGAYQQFATVPVEIAAKVSVEIDMRTTRLLRSTPDARSHISRRRSLVVVS